ncbi:MULTISPECIES: protein kinase [unclassified Fibrobacter]|uniref:serine/threonine protein kinase n=1 Tax=unclassified Fibrobacter TaxID=2634177 RepID=UPI000D6C0B3D|nr:MULTISPECIES: protein kinase [unclassified Fibrobacter]PWJ60984.1 protein kinase-like protein [Fibrobacter sp. UWR4]PZW65479.1 protein kinase-like protein [Fibrobacter sp. UWR1]
MIRNILAETLDRLARNLAMRPHYTMEEYQRWFDQNPKFLHNGAIQKIELTAPLALEGTNNLYRANYWLEQPKTGHKTAEQEIVVKICKYWVPPGKNRIHRLNMTLSAFQDEIRINNLIRATNIEGVVQSMGGGTAGRHPYLKMEFIKGCSLDKTFREGLSDDDILHRVAQLAYLANTISQLHYYQVVHKDLKPKNLLLCQNPEHKNNHKILVCDFGYAQAKMRETITEYGGQITPYYSAPEQAIMGENLSASVDYFSFGMIAHEYLTGRKLFPKAMDIFMEDGYRVTDRYLEYIKHGRENVFHDSRFPYLAQWMDCLTMFDSFERMQNSPNLFDIAHKLREQVNAQGYRDVNTDFLWNQLREYNH